MKITMNPTKKIPKKSKHFEITTEKSTANGNLKEYYLRSNKKSFKVIKPNLKKPKKSLTFNKKTKEIHDPIDTSNIMDLVPKEFPTLLSDVNISEVNTVLNNQNNETVKLEEQKSEVNNKVNANAKTLKNSEHTQGLDSIEKLNQSIEQDILIAEETNENKLTNVHENDHNIIVKDENPIKIESQHIVPFACNKDKNINMENNNPIIINELENTNINKLKNKNDSKILQKYLLNSETGKLNNNRELLGIRKRRVTKAYVDSDDSLSDSLNLTKKYNKNKNKNCKRASTISDKSTVPAKKIKTSVDGKSIIKVVNNTVIKTSSSTKNITKQNINSLTEKNHTNKVQSKPKGDSIIPILKLIDGRLYLAYLSTPKIYFTQINKQKLSLKLIVHVSKIESSNIISIPNNDTIKANTTNNNTINQYNLTIYPPNLIEEFINTWKNTTKSFALVNIKKYIEFCTSESKLTLSNYEKIIIGKHVLSPKCLELMLQKYKQFIENQLINNNYKNNNQRSFRVIVNSSANNNVQLSTHSYFINDCGLDINEQKIETFDLIRKLTTNEISKKNIIKIDNNHPNVLNNMATLINNKNTEIDKYFNSGEQVPMDSYIPSRYNINKYTKTSNKADINLINSNNIQLLKDKLPNAEHNDRNIFNVKNSRLVHVPNLQKINSLSGIKNVLLQKANPVFKNQTTNNNLNNSVPNSVEKDISHTITSNNQEQMNSPNWEKFYIENENNSNIPTAIDTRNYHLGDFNLQDEIEEFEKILANVYKTNEYRNMLSNESISIDQKQMPIRPKPVKAVYNNICGNNIYNTDNPDYVDQKSVYNHNQYLEYYQSINKYPQSPINLSQYNNNNNIQKYENSNNYYNCIENYNNFHDTDCNLLQQKSCFEQCPSNLEKSYFEQYPTKSENSSIEQCPSKFDIYDKNNEQYDEIPQNIVKLVFEIDDDKEFKVFNGHIDTEEQI